jgi:3-mercaptopropionate dioxygenase
MMTSKVHTVRSATVQQLIAEIRAVVIAEYDPAVVGSSLADCLRPYLMQPDLLTPDQFEPHPNRYRQHVLHVEPDGSFSIVAVVWLPGQMSLIHDHVSWCVVGVHRGEEHETIYALAGEDDDPHLVIRDCTDEPARCVRAGSR